MSNRDRIARAAAEADATARERDEKRKQAPAARAPSNRHRARNEPAQSNAGRMKLVWAVHAPNGSTVATYPYPQRSAADAEAERLTIEKDQKHYVQQAKVPIDD
jgi:hypothetical protein